MDIADQIAHRALAYVEAVNRQGHRLTVREFEAYVQGHARAQRRVGGLGEQLLALQGLTALGSWAALTGTRQDESVLEWLVRLMWVRVSQKSNVDITPLGAAVLRELDTQGVASEGPGLVVFTAEDPYAYAHVVSHIAKVETEFLADPYLRLEAIPTLVEFTSVRRVLVGDRADLKGLAIAVNGLPEDRGLEMRVSDRFHDRYAIPTSGEVLSLGTSLGGFGKRAAVMTTLAPPGADEIRKLYETLWGDADPLPTGQKAAPPKKSSAAKEASGRRRSTRTR